MSAVRLEIDAEVATLTLDNESKLNALTGAMLDELEDRCAELECCADVACVLLVSAGERAFCVGADIGEWSALSPADFARGWVRRGHRAFDRLARLPIPSVAVIDGHAFGGGLELAACADVRVMASGATLGLPETSIGVVPGWSGTQRLMRLLPEPVLREMALFGRRLDTARALGLGFVAAVANDAAGAHDAARSIARTVAPRSREATGIAKAMLDAAAGEDRDAAIEALASGFAAAGADKAEGVASFLEKRAPRFAR